MATTPEIVAKCWGMRDYVTLSPGKLSDALAVLALQHGDRIVARNHAIMRQNLATAKAWAGEYADIISWTPPRGGLLAMLRYQLDIPSIDLANKLAEEYSVMLAPGSAFGLEHHLRMGIGQKPSIFAEGLFRTSTCFASLTSEL
jgi:aspartate/methionine/tyrosine aminotransferase